MFLVAYDVTNEQSFNACNKWYERCRAQKPNENIPGKPLLQLIKYILNITVVYI